MAISQKERRRYVDFIVTQLMSSFQVRVFVINLTLKSVLILFGVTARDRQLLVQTTLFQKVQVLQADTFLLQFVLLQFVLLQFQKHRMVANRLIRYQQNTKSLKLCSNVYHAVYFTASCVRIVSTSNKSIVFIWNIA